MEGPDTGAALLEDFGGMRPSQVAGSVGNFMAMKLLKKAEKKAAKLGQATERSQVRGEYAYHPGSLSVSPPQQSKTKKGL